jgi:hypothetical protein
MFYFRLLWYVYCKPTLDGLGRDVNGMNDQQSEEMVKNLKRIADALERLSPPPQPEEAAKVDDTLKTSGNTSRPDIW